ncbi:probable vacuolar sorting protein VPS4 [Cephalotrichum gorgonifer]|uniref:vesicle-fusing ATPase n=1 Tax=Cephalotrichum gorgonifer TaxID=2041049 RepID=A0AAE8MSZ0_9PEZI|nr:probable vacuolar sorting protein VPS4 [Cephalotrichum gorgonifer]
MSGITDFLGKAIATVKKAIDADNDQEYAKAFQLYTSSIELFLLAAKWEKNPKSKDMIRGKATEYMDRAEKLKVFLAESEAKPNGAGKGGGGSPGGGGGASAKKEKAGSGLDEDAEKLRNALQSIVVMEKPNVAWGDVAGLEDAKEALQEAVVLPIQYPSIFTGNRQPWKGILMYGPPGTGKSYLAKAVATETGGSFFNVKSSDLVSKWMGESERLIKQLFAMARESKPTVIFIDEIDALCSARGEGGESEASRRIKTEFLVQMDGVDNNNEGILVLGATNLPWGLDIAMMRRFQRVVHIGLPNPAGRAKLFKMAMGDTPSTLTMHDFAELARISDGYSGSDIANVVKESLMYPVRKITRATHFKRVDVDGQKKYAPCSPGDPEAVEMSLSSIKDTELAVPLVEFRDVVKALKDSAPTSNAKSLEKYVEWANARERA